ncbi:glycosyltransferase family 87 protein [Methylobacterium sp. J-090]|uniref:glycosyltransferase family 87 protein n=1 Tax=Methylobacterium sp. J-090 TaxID=2836666 RepID=UPI001FB9AB58|nr:glycosyltransferase family 87 protein [Methylobacterium sp. J-090]MCJ2081560.1 DUF2029 domain-containing protein [Methylobacterium sp. J-090]
MRTALERDAMIPRPQPARAGGLAARADGLAATARPDTDMARPSLLLPAILALLAVLLIAKTVELTGQDPGRITTLIDFDAFRIAGRLVWRGEIAQAYHFVTMLEAQRTLGAPDAFLPWTYPPVFNLVVAPFAHLPRGLGYLLFTGGTLAAYIVVLRRLAPQHLGALLALLFPALAVTIACGQNGFLTGALVGTACLYLLRRDPRAGLPLGLMAIKPHLAVGFALHAAMTRDWRTALTAACVAAASAGLATLILGPSIWSAFLGGVAEARVFLEQGLYPLFRMISAYAAVRTLGAPASVAMAAQVGVALVALGLVAFAIHRRMPIPQVVGLTALASLLVSPYAYDYDLPILGVGLALLAPDLLARATPRERIAVFVLVWVASGWGLAMTGLLRLWYGAEGLPLGAMPLSLAGPALMALVGLIWRVLRRRPAIPAAPRS